MSTEKNLIWVANFPLADIVSGNIEIVHGIVGAPQKTGISSANELVKAHVFGIYRREGDSEFSFFDRRKQPEKSHILPVLPNGSPRFTY
jgi:hypothetical protein